jgi:recombination protein RecA
MAVRKKNAKAASLAAAINTALKLDHGIRVGSDPYFTIERILTGSLTIDRITGGGWALGRHYELFGDENAGKSTITYLTMALSQQRGNLCAVVDPEHAFDNERFSFLGGYPEELLMFHPENSEQAIAVMMLLAKYAEEQMLEIITIDSVSSLVTTEEMEKDPREEDRIASQARMMSRALRRITAVNRKTLFLWTNQERTDVGIRFGNPKVTSGGKALRYYATGRLEFRLGQKEMAKRQRPRAGKMVESDVEIGRWVQVRAVKEKSTRPLREGSFVFSHELRRIDPASEIIMLGLEDGLIENSAGRYEYVDIDDYEWRGTYKQFSGWVRDNPQLQKELTDAISENSCEDVYETTDEKV